MVPIEVSQASYGAANKTKQNKQTKKKATAKKYCKLKRVIVSIVLPALQ